MSSSPALPYPLMLSCNAYESIECLLGFRNVHLREPQRYVEAAARPTGVCLPCRSVSSTVGAVKPEESELD